MYDRLKPLLLPALLILVAAFSGSGLALAVLIDDDGDGIPDRTIQLLEKAAEQQLAAPTVAPAETVPPTEAPAGDLEVPSTEPDALKDSTPEDVPAQKLEDGQEASEKLGEALEPKPTGGAQNYSCRQDFSGQVYSSRNGVNPTEWVNHYTVSSNRAGWGDVLGIQSYFKNSRVASSTYIVDFEGNCLQMVPESAKPWTQGAFNPSSISVEIIATGSESRAEWLAAPLFKNGILAAIARDSMRRHGIPLRRVNPTGCTAIPGWTDHNSLECGNNHTDTTPGFPDDVFQRQLTQGVKPSPLTRKERQIVHRTSKGSRRSKRRACKQNVAHRAHLRRASRRNPAADRKRRRGARRSILHDNYKKRC